MSSEQEMIILGILQILLFGKKMALWRDIQKRYEIDDAAMDWFMATAGAKWKQFKATLKRQFYDETLTDEQLKNLEGHRVDDDEWNYLIDYWRSPESEALTARGKQNRSKLKFPHTSGSVSYACTAHKLGKKLGRPPRRDEVYIKTHTRKTGVPLRTAESTINELKKVVETRPELMSRTIQQGDVFAAICGEKEPRGRVRVVGLGPTPQDIGAPGLKAYTSTRLQIQVLARKQAESENEVLQQRIAQMEEREEQRMARESPNVETPSYHGSNSRQHLSPRSEELGEANYQHVQGEGDYEYTDIENFDEVPDEANEQIAALAASPAMNITATPRSDDREHFSHDALAGNEVILYDNTGHEKVAKGIVVSTNPNNMLGGLALGRKFCEVIVDLVLRRETILPRTYAEIMTLGDAEKMPIAWQYNRLKVCSKQGAVGSCQGAARSSQRPSQGAAAAVSSQGAAAVVSSQGAAAGSLQRTSSQASARSSQRL